MAWSHDGAFLATRCDSMPTAVFVYDCDRTVFPWTCTQRPVLLANDGEPLDQLGFSVAIVGNTVIAGAVYCDVNGVSEQGAVYTFQCPAQAGEACPQVAKLSPTAGVASMYFGYSLALSGSHVIVGAPGATAGTVPQAGAAYVYTCTSPATCTLVATLTDPSASPLGWAGTSVAMIGANVVVGASPPSGPNATVGAALVYACSYAGSTSPWACDAPQRLVVPTAVSGDGFGYAVALSNSTVAVGAPYTGPLQSQGVLYSFGCVHNATGALSCQCSLPTLALPECVECQPEHYGQKCLPCSTCAAHGTCAPGLAGQCTCNAGWAGEDCSVCAENHYGEACTDCVVCNLHGTCMPGGTGLCICDQGWQGPSCQEPDGTASPPTWGAARGVKGRAEGG